MKDFLETLCKGAVGAAILVGVAKVFEDSNLEINPAEFFGNRIQEESDPTCAVIDIMVDNANNQIFTSDKIKIVKDIANLAKKSSNPEIKTKAINSINEISKGIVWSSDRSKCNKIIYEIVTGD